MPRIPTVNCSPPRYGAPLLAGLVCAWAVVIGLGNCAPARAESCGTYAWTNDNGQGNEQWTTETNWQPAGVPGRTSHCDSVTIKPSTEETAPDVQNVPRGTQLKNLTVEEAELTACPTGHEQASACGGGLTVTGEFRWGAATPLSGSALNLPVTVEGESSLVTNPEQNQGLALRPGASLTFDGPANLEGEGELYSFSSGGTVISNNSTMSIAQGFELASNCCRTENALANNGQIVVGPGSGVASFDGMALDDKGSVSVGAGSTLAIEAPQLLSVGDSFAGGGRVLVEGDGEGEGTRLASGVKLESGTTFEVAGTGAALEGSGTFTGEGNFRWAAGAQVYGSLTLGESITATISAPAGVPALLREGTLTLDGRTTLSGEDGLRLQFGNVVNRGTLRLEAGTQVSGGGLEQAAGSTTLDGATIESAESIVVSGGVLAGHGTLHGGLANLGGTVRPAVDSGPLLVEGNYSQSSAGTVETDLAGVAGSEYGQLEVLGDSSLAGAIDVKVLAGFAPAPGDRVQAIRSGSEEGEFSVLSGGPQYGVAYEPDATEVVFGSPGGALPAVTRASPKKGSPEGGTPVTITGSGFVNVTGVKIGGTRVMFTVTSPTSITASTPPGIAGATVDVVVQAADGNSPTGTKDHYTYEGPVITGVSPSSGPLAGGGTVTITGYGFAPGSATTLDFKKTPGSTVDCTSSFSCTVVSPVAAKAGTVDITAIVGTARSKKSRGDRYIYE